MNQAFEIVYKKELRFNEIAVRIIEYLSFLKTQNYRPVIQSAATLQIAISHLEDKYNELVQLCDQINSPELREIKERTHLKLINIQTSLNQLINDAEIQKNARIIGKLSQLSSNPFSRLPTEINLEIVKFGIFRDTGLTEKANVDLAAANYALARTA